MRVTFTVTSMISSNIAFIIIIIITIIIIIIISHERFLSSLLYGSETKLQTCIQNTALETDRKKYDQEWKKKLRYSYSTTNKMHLLSQIIYSCKTLYMFRTVFQSIIRSSKLRIQQRYMSNSCWPAVWHIPLLYTQFRAPDDGLKDRPKYVERFTRINNLR